MTLPDHETNFDTFAEGDFDLNLLLSGDWVADNFDMHDKFGVHDAVDALDNDKLLKFVEFRIKFLEEELNEAKAAFAKLSELQDAQLPDETHDKLVTDNAEDIVDAMVDLCVVAIGTLNAMNVDAYEAWERVHTANMAKEVGIKASRPNPLGLPDLIKPEGWVGPQHRDNIGHFAKFTTTGEQPE
jgi:predicted HAD superfamily Cof-like phosphohydrolase